jgi:activator of Hsp90 ATPase-like protein
MSVSARKTSSGKGAKRYRRWGIRSTPITFGTGRIRDRVFTAWTTSEAIKVWFGPEDCRVLKAEIDLRVGGEYSFTLSTRRLGEIKVSGRYREVTPPAKLIYTWRWEGHSELAAETSLVTVQFIPTTPSVPASAGGKAIEVILACPWTAEIVYRGALDSSLP